MAPECYSSNLRARQVHGGDLKITSQCPGRHRIVLVCAPAAQEHCWDSGSAAVPALPAFTSTGWQRVLGGWRQMRRAVPCSSAEKTQPKGQGECQTLPVFGSCCCALQAVLRRGCDHSRALAHSLFQPSGQELFPEHSPLPWLPQTGGSFSHLLPSWRGCVGRGGAGDVQGT